MRPVFSQKNLIFPLVSWLFGAFLAVYSYQFYEQGGLLDGHQEFLDQINAGNYFAVIHPGIYWLAVALNQLTAIPLHESLFRLLSLHFAATFFVTMIGLKLLDTDAADPYLIFFAAVAVMIAMPLGLPFLPPEVYNYSVDLTRVTLLLRNATHTAMQPYAIGAFCLTMAVIRKLKSGEFATKMAVAASVLLFISVLMKPSFAFSFIPSLGLYLLFKRSFSFNDKLKVVAIAVPAGWLLCGQFYINYIHPIGNFDLHSAVSFTPFEAWIFVNKKPLWALVTAILFPLMVLCCRLRKISEFTWIAWINLAIALIPQSLFWLGGLDNEWSYLDAREILFLCSIVEWWRWLKEDRVHILPGRFGVAHFAGLILLMHVMFGYMRMITIDMPSVHW